MNFKKKELYFVLKFFVLFSVLQLLIIIVDITTLQQWIASFAAGWAGLPSEGIGIFVKDGMFLVTENCTGLISSFILGSIIFSLQKPSFPKKITLFLLATLALLIINLFRVYFVVLIGATYGLSAGETVHVISWFVMSAAIIVLWYYGTKRIANVQNFSGFL